MAVIAFRLVTANAALCNVLAPVPGLAIHALGQYPTGARTAARRAFGFEAPIAVAAVVPGSPAAAAAIAAGDSIVAVAGVPLDTDVELAVGSEQRDRALAVIAAQPADAPLHLRLVRDGRARDVVVAASPGWRSNFEVSSSAPWQRRRMAASCRSASAFLERYDDGAGAAAVPPVSLAARRAGGNGVNHAAA